jgi:hypothetical protein
VKVVREALYAAAVAGTFAVAYGLSTQSTLRSTEGNVGAQQHDVPVPLLPPPQPITEAKSTGVPAPRLPASAGALAPPTGGTASPVASESQAMVRTAPQQEVPAEPILDPLPERDRLLAKLRATGPDELDLKAAVVPVQKAWNELLEQAHIEASFSPWECFREGCATTVVHGTSDVVDDFSASLTRANEFRAWNGGKIQSGAIKRPDERVEVTWILLAPFREPAEGSAVTDAQDPMDRNAATAARGMP